MKKKVSIRIQIFMIYSLIFVTACGFFATSAMTNFSSTLKKTEEKNMDRELELIINSLDVLLTDCEKYLNVISTDRELVKIVENYVQNKETDKGKLEQIRKEINAVLSNVIAPNTKLIGASVMVDGQILCASYSINEADIREVLDDDHLSQILSSQRASWGELSEVSFLDQPRENVLPISKSIMNKETGEKTGIVTMYLSENELSNIYEKTNSQKNSYYILDRSRRIVSSLDKAVVGQKYDMDSSADEWRMMKHYERRDWDVLCITDQSVFLQTKKKMIRDNLLILLVILIFMFGFSYVVSFSITKPLYELLEVMKKIEKGDTKIRSQCRKNDEFGTLSREFNKLIDEQQKAMQQIYQHQKSKRKSELLLLQSQIKPHFLYNTMETIASFIKLDEKKMALETIQRLSGFYRKSLSMGREIVRVEEEIAIIEEYLKIQSLRYKSYMDYSIEVQDSILKYDIPKLTLQPLVENSIYHGLKQKDEQGVLIVRGYEQDEKLCFEVFDTGNGMTEEKKKEIEEKLGKNAKTSEHGFGLYNVAERLRLFYGDECDMLVDSEYEEYTQITIIIPKKGVGETC